MTNAHELLLSDRTANMDSAPSTCSYFTVYYIKKCFNKHNIFFKHPTPYHISVWTTYIKLWCCHTNMIRSVLLLCRIY